jgi:hypothetical protein
MGFVERLRLMSESFAVESVERVGELDLVAADGRTVECDLVLMPEWRTRVPTLINDESSSPAGA